MPHVNDIANRMVFWVSSLSTFIQIMFFSGLIELAMVFMHRNKALPKGAYDKIIIIRRAIQVICTSTVFYVIFRVYAWTGHRLINGLADRKKPCSNDPMLEDTFKYMKVYLDHSQDL